MILKMSKILILCLLLFAGCRNNTQKKHPVKKQISIAQKIAGAAGLSNWNNVNSIAFTFNVKIGDKQIHRTWYWEPKNDIIKFYLPNKKDSTVFSQAKTDKSSSPEIIKRDKQFINDSYWLLFPFHLVWDNNVSITLQKNLSASPIGGKQAGEVVVKYTADKGYTPNDKYILYIDGNNNIIEWAYYKNSSSTPSRVTKWKDYKKFGPLTISLNRPGENDNFRVWFTNVEVK